MEKFHGIYSEGEWQRESAGIYRAGPGWVLTGGEETANSARSQVDSLGGARLALITP